MTETISDERFWRHKNGEWTVASFLVRSLCGSVSAGFITHAELYYILDSLGVKKRFAEYWDYSEFHLAAGVAEFAVSKVKKEDGWRAKTGDVYWAFGDLENAREYYELDVKKPYPQHARDGMRGSAYKNGWAGLFRLNFVEQRYGECVELFKRFCPPYDYYVARKNIRAKHKNEFTLECLREERRLRERFSRKNDSFISTSRPMMKCVIIAFQKSEKLDGKAVGMVSDFFSIPANQIETLELSLRNNERQFRQVIKYITPKPVGRSCSISKFLRTGETEKAKRVKAQIEGYRDVVAGLSQVLVDFLEAGDESVLSNMTGEDAPFGYSDMDAELFSAALESVVDDALEMPERQLFLMRKFSLFTGYPRSGRSLGEDGGWSRDGHDYIIELQKIVSALNIKPEPIDVIIGLRSINWFARGDEFNYALMKREMEWSMALLPSFISKNYNREIFQTRETFEAFLRSAFLFLEEKYEEAKSQQRWKTEEKLATAIKSLFGKEHIQQHASPIWLSPQHLDIYLPECKLAIEYMGKQHYEPVDFFGGQEAFEATVARDQHKKQLCERMGINLIYVTHEEDVGLRAREIFSLYGKSLYGIYPQ